MTTFSALPEPEHDLDHGRPDEDLEPPSRTALDELRGIAGAVLTPATDTYQVPTRPGWAVTYSAGIDDDKVKHWIRRGTVKSGPDKGLLDQAKWAALVLGTQAVAILKDGQHPTDQGEPITFRDPAMLELTGADSVSECVRVFYGGKDHIGDGHMVAQALRLLRLAGYDADGVQVGAATADDLPDEDPTPR